MLLGELPGVVCQMNDGLVFGSNKSEHDKWLCATLEKLRRAVVTLNAEKCEFNRQTVKFLGHIMNKERITSLDAPKNRKELLKFFGMINY